MAEVKFDAHEHITARALILDLDGTVRRSKSGKTFIDGPEDIELMPGIEEKIWSFRNDGFLILGASNQAGVAYGYKTEDIIGDEVDVMVALFKENPFHAIKTCLCHEKGSVAPYNHRSLCRKPSIGMLVLLENDLYEYGVIIDWDNSLFVGDREEDEACANNAGVPFMHVDAFLNINHVSVE